MLTIKRLKEELAKFPDDAFVFADERVHAGFRDFDFGLAVVLVRGPKYEKHDLGFIKAEVNGVRDDGPADVYKAPDHTDL